MVYKYLYVSPSSFPKSKNSVYFFCLNANAETLIFSIFSKLIWLYFFISDNRDLQSFVLMLCLFPCPLFPIYVLCCFQNQRSQMASLLFFRLYVLFIYFCIIKLYVHLFILVCISVWDTVFHVYQSGLNLSVQWGWPWTPNPLTCTSKVLGLQACSNIPVSVFLIGVFKLEFC